MADQLTRPGDAQRAGRLGRGVLAMVAFAVPVALIAFAVRQQFDPLIHADKAIIKAATDATRTAGTADLWLAVQRATQPLLLYCLATGVCIWAWAARGLRTRAIWAFVTMMVSWNMGLLLKLLVQRARPIVQDPISHAPGYSFPSGHAFNATVIATALVFLLWPVLGRVGHRVSTAVAAVGVVVVGLDRIFLGVHFPSDVIAGIVLGGGITFSSWLGFIGRTSSTSSVGPSHPA